MAAALGILVPVKVLRLLPFLLLLATREVGVETQLSTLGPWGPGTAISHVLWLDDERLLIVEDDWAHFVRVDRGITYSEPLRLRRVLGALGDEWLVSRDTDEGTVEIWKGPLGAERHVANSAGPLRRWEVAWDEDGAWLRGWIPEGDPADLGPPAGPAWWRGGRLWLLDVRRPGALWRLGEDGLPVPVAEGDEEAGVRLAAAASAADGSALVVENRDVHSRLVLVSSGGEREVVGEWTEDLTYGVYGEDALAWRESPRRPGPPQRFCAPACERVPAGRWMQSRAWSLGGGRWLLPLLDLVDGGVELALYPGMEPVARVDRLHSVAVSPDRSRFALVRAVARRGGDWDVVVVDAPAP